MMRQSYLACSAGLLLAIAACDRSTGLSTGISQADANKLAADMDAVSTFSTSDFGLGPSFSVSVGGSGSSAAVIATVIPIHNTFIVTRECPKGGTVKIVGSVDGTGDRTTHSLTLEANATRTDTGCAFETRNGILILTGIIVYKGNLNIVNGALSGLQTQTHEGSFDWARGGATGTCKVELMSSFDPATHTVKVTGEVCGHTVNVTRTRGS